MHLLYFLGIPILFILPILQEDHSFFSNFSPKLSSFLLNWYKFVEDFELKLKTIVEPQQTRIKASEKLSNSTSHGEL
ncbi:hypothetical protein V6Z11_D01G130400 [Gossypium hirsutum]